MTLNEYLNLITSEHRQKPKYIAMLTADLALPIQVQDLMREMMGPLFNLNTPPVGDQLDIIGQWVGASRHITTPISGAYFTWDGSNPAVGWDYGVWASTVTPGAITTLPDDIYLSLIKAKIAANSWDGTTDGAYAVWAIAFPNLTLLIQDHQNMTMTVILVGEPLSALTLALLTGGYLPLKPEGVLIDEYIVPSSTDPLFGWDMDTDYVKGWNEGAWGIEIKPT